MISSNPGLLWFSDDAGVIVFNPKADSAHVLNPRASLLLLLCDGTGDSASVLKAANEIEPAKDSNGSLANDSQWLEQAQQNDLVIEGDVPGRAPRTISSKKLRKLTNALLESSEAVAARRCAIYLTSKKPKNSENWNLLGDCEHALGNYPAAKAAYEKVVELDPENITIAHLITALSGGAPPDKASAEYVRQTFDDYAESFDKSLVDDLGYKTPEIITKALKPYLPEPARQYRIADLGCGTGLMGKAIEPWARSICGVDLSSQMMSKALLTGCYNEVHVSEIAEWLISDSRTYELVLAADVFVYFGDLLEVMKQVRPKLDSSSKFAFSVELGEKHGFELTVSGRYAHHPDYILNIARESGLQLLSMEKETLRWEYGKKVVGLVVILSRG